MHFTGGQPTPQADQGSRSRRRRCSAISCRRRSICRATCRRSATRASRARASAGPPPMRRAPITPSRSSIATPASRRTCRARPGSSTSSIMGNDCDGGSIIPDAMKVLMRGRLFARGFPLRRHQVPAAADRRSATKADRLPDRRASSRSGTSSKATRPRQGQGRAGQGQSGGHPRHRSTRPSGISTPQNAGLGRRRRAPRTRAATPSRWSATTMRTQTFKFINPWSTSWGDDGYGRMTYDTFAARTAEGYVMHMPGDPEVTLTDADFDRRRGHQTAPPAAPPKPPAFEPPLNVRPTDASRDLEASLPTPPMSATSPAARSTSPPTPAATASPAASSARRPSSTRSTKRSRARSTTTR